MPQTWTTHIRINGVRIRVSGTFSRVMAAIRANMPDASRSREKLAPGIIRHFIDSRQGKAG